MFRFDKEVSKLVIPENFNILSLNIFENRCMKFYVVLTSEKHYLVLYFHFEYFPWS